MLIVLRALFTAFEKSRALIYIIFE